MIALAAVPSGSRPIGFWTSVALVIGNMIGSGVFLLPASLAPFGAVSLLGWTVSAAGAICLALTFARLSAHAPAAGGPYAYTRLAYGDLAGFLVAWGYWISIWCSNAALAIAFVGYLDPFIPAIVRNPPLAATLAVTLLWTLTLVNVRGVEGAGKVQIVTTALKILPLAAIGIAGVVMFDATRLAPAAGDSIAHGVMATATLTLWAFLGLESGTVPAGETEDAARTIPRATILGTLLTAAIYLIATVGVMSILEPGTLGRSTAPFADAARRFGGEGAATLVALGAAISSFGCLNGWVLVVGQLPMAAARDGLFPRAFATISGRGTPAFAMIVSAALSTALVTMNYSRGLVALFTFVILLATLSTLVPYTFCSLAGFVIHRRDPKFAWPAGAAVVSSLAFAYSLFAIGGAGADVVFWGFLLLLCGLPVYVATSGRAA
ncbi:MAG TPA: amino acid permease [Vicinamibacterales bacterium]|nr:amino acid permease [Vicinamibacterales bacterium]